MRILRFGLVVALSFGAMPASYVFAQDSSASTAAPTTITGNVTGSAASGFQLSAVGGPIVAGAPRTFDLKGDPTTLAGAVGQGIMDVSGTLDGTTLTVTSLAAHEGLLPLARPARPAPTTITGNVTGSAASGFQLSAAGGPIVAGAPRTFDLKGDPTTLAGAVGQGIMDVSGTLDGTTLTVTSLSAHEGVLPLARPAPASVASAALPVLVVSSVKKHEGVLPLNQPAAAPAGTSVIGNVSGDKGSGFTLALAGGPIVAGAPRTFTLEATGANLSALADAATGGYLVDVNGTLKKPASSDTTVTGWVSGDASSGFSMDRAGGPIIEGQQRTFALKGHAQELADAVTGHYLVTVTGKLVNGTIRVRSVTKFSGVLPLVRTPDAAPSGKGIINAPGLDSPPR